MICTPNQILLGVLNKEEWDGWIIWHVWEAGVLRTGFW